MAEKIISSEVRENTEVRVWVENSVVAIKEAELIKV